MKKPLGTAPLLTDDGQRHKKKRSMQTLTRIFNIRLFWFLFLCNQVVIHSLYVFWTLTDVKHQLYCVWVA